LLGLGNSKLASAFLGNPFSDAIQYFQNSSAGARNQAAADAAAYYAPKALNKVPDVAVSYTSTTVTASPSEVNVFVTEFEALLPLGKVATGAADLLEGLTNLVTIPIDITATSFGAVVCTAGHP
jgi:hypothetical protein